MKGVFMRAVRGMVSVAPAVATAIETILSPKPSTPTSSPQPKGHTMNWLSAILGLIPVIAQGIHTIHSDATVGTKTQLASDALNLVIAGAQATAPAAQQPLVTGFGAIAQQTLAATVAALHAGSATPAPAGA